MSDDDRFNTATTVRSLSHRVIRFALFLGLLAGGLGASLPSFAQGRDTGTLTLEMRGPDGVPVAGAPVTVSGPQNERVVRSDEAGVVVLRGLVPGLYAVRTMAPGFRETRRDDLLVSVGRSTRVRFDLELEGIAEVLVVDAAAPLIDPGTLHVGAIVDDALVDLTPSGAGLFSGVLDKVPGLILSGVDVGGANATQQQSFTAHGSLPGQNQFYLDGSPTTAASNGAAGMFYPLRALTEVEVSTAAHDIAYQTPGVIVNMVTKSGSNSLHGGARFFYSDETLAGENVTEELIEQGVSSGNPNTLLSELNLQLGGPLIRDRLWGFVDYNRFDEHRRILGLSEQDQDERSLRNLSAKLDWQVSRNQRLALRYFMSSKFRLNADASVSTPPESSILQDPTDAHVGQLNWLGAWSDQTFSDVRVSYKDHVFGWTGRRPDSPAPHPDYPLGVPYSFDFFTGQWSGAPDERRIWDRDYSVAFNVNHTAAAGDWVHDLKFGGQWRDARRWIVDVATGNTFQVLAGGAPAYALLWTTPPTALESASRHDGSAEASREFGLYVQDTVQMGARWTVTAGLRFDTSSVWIPEQRRPDSGWADVMPDEQFGEQFRAQTFPEQEVMGWHSFTPRLSASFDLSGKHRTFLKAGYAQYTLQPNSRLAQSVNPVGVGYNEYEWNDLSGDGIFQWGEQGRLTFASHPNITTGIDPDLRAARTHEFTLGMEHQTASDLVLGATAIYRTLTNGIEDINTGVPYGPVADRLGVGSPYAPVDTVDPGPDGVAGTADDGEILTVWSQDPATFGQDFFLLTNPAEWGFDAGYSYRALELTARKRFTDRWQALASWTIGRIDSDFAGSTGLQTTNVFDNPNADINRTGRTAEDRTHVVKLNASYLFTDPIGINVGASLRYESGPPIRRLFRPAWGTVNQGRPSIVAAPYGEDDNPASLGGRMSSITVLDLRAEKQFVLPGSWGRMSLALDAFNILNENAERSVGWFAGPNYGRVLGIVPPRLLRLNLGWVF